MQVSVSFNATNSPIQKAGSRDRDNLLLGGKYYILAVNEFRAFLTYKYGPTAQITEKSEIKGRRGIIIFGDAHIELWDGDAELQAPNGKKTKAGKCEFIGSLLSTPPQWFWEVNGDSSVTTTSSVVPNWVVGWWTVYDGNTYYYYFFPDGHVVYIEQAPNKHWIPPKTLGNHGKAYTNEKVHGVSIIWALRSGEAEPTCEDFTQLNWSSQTDMNGQSNKYSPLYARKITRLKTRSERRSTRTDRVSKLRLLARELIDLLDLLRRQRADGGVELVVLQARRRGRGRTTARRARCPWARRGRSA